MYCRTAGLDTMQENQFWEPCACRTLTLRYQTDAHALQEPFSAGVEYDTMSSQATSGYKRAVNACMQESRLLKPPTHLACEQLPHHDTKAEDVSLLVVWLVLNHFRRHPPVRPCFSSHVAAGLNHAGNTKVSNLDLQAQHSAIQHNQQVRRVRTPVEQRTQDGPTVLTTLRAVDTLHMPCSMLSSCTNLRCWCCADMLASLNSPSHSHPAAGWLP